MVRMVTRFADAGARAAIMLPHWNRASWMTTDTPQIQADAAPLASELTLAPFDTRHADLIASWVRDDRELYWLAPRTPAPLTPQKVMAWCMRGRRPFMFAWPDAEQPVAYGELNTLDPAARIGWIGHMIVDPSHRGRGICRAAVMLMLDYARRELGMWRVALVVFPDNRSAVRCYRACDFRSVGYEQHRFRPGAETVRLLRMELTL
jgi:RimJ/RimL family protein N-acetyltransferase